MKTKEKQQKLLSIVVPCYNSAAYLASCLESLLIGLDDKLEVIIVNDGSTDATSAIAHEYCGKYSFMRVIDKENAGHGSGVNIGIKEATGLYFKVLDSDDRLERFGLLNLLYYIEEHKKANTLPDVYFTDYISVNNDDPTDMAKVSIRKKMKVINEVTTYKGMKKLRPVDFMMMHMVYVKTSMLKENNVQVLEHCFYEDNQYLFNSLLLANTICYLDKPIYLYSVGRVGQSISLEKMAKNYHFQNRVMEACVELADYSVLKSFDKYKRRVVLHDFYIIAFLSYFYSYLQSDKNKRRDYRILLKGFKNGNKLLYRKVYHRSPVLFLHLIPVFFRHLIIKISYDLYSKNLGWS